MKNKIIYKTFIIIALSFFAVPYFALADASSGWWGQINANGVIVRKSPSVDSPKIGSLSSINRVKILDTASGNGGTWYQIDGGAYPGGYISSDWVDKITQPIPPSNPDIPPGVNSGDYWIDVNISKEILTLFQYNQPVLATYISTGKFSRSTMAGTFHIWEKLNKTRMHGGPPATDHVYDLPNVPWTMYYSGSFAVHGTYWHDKFGTPQSAGCTNLTQGDAKFVFDRVNVGTTVYNHY